MHAHIQRSLAKAYSKFNDSAIVSLFVLCHNFGEKLCNILLAFYLQKYLPYTRKAFARLTSNAAELLVHTLALAYRCYKSKGALNLVWKANKKDF